MHARPLAVALIVVAAALPRPAAATKVCAYTIPTGMVDKVESKNARIGGYFRFVTMADVTLADGTPIPTGTPGYGVIRAASAAARRNHDGMLSIEPRYLILPKGKRVEVTMTPTLPVTWGPSEPLLNKAVARVPLPIPGLIMTGVNQVRWGRNITLGPGFHFSVLPIGNLAQGPIC